MLLQCLKNSQISNLWRNWTQQIIHPQIQNPEEFQHAKFFRYYANQIVPMQYPTKHQYIKLSFNTHIVRKGKEGKAKAKAYNSCKKVSCPNSWARKPFKDEPEMFLQNRFPI